MSDLSEYSTLQQKVINKIIEGDNGFHRTYMIGDTPFYDMLDELDNGEYAVKKNVTSPLSTGSIDYNLQLFYSEEQKCWFYNFNNLGDEICGIVRYNTIMNAMGEVAFAILNDNDNDVDITASLPYSNILVLRK